MPNLIALTSEAAGPRFRGTAVSLMYCGVPIGAALAAALGFSGPASARQTVFWVGGVIPLLLVPVDALAAGISGLYPTNAGGRRTVASALFAPATASATLLLWLCYFFTLLVVYMLINWLPMLLVEQGFRPSQAAGVMFALGKIGAASGTLILGALMDKLRPVVMSLLIHTGMLASLLALGTVSSLSGMLMAGFVAGCSATGGQSVLLCAGAAVLQHADPRHRRGNRRRSRASGGDERSAAGRKMLALGTGRVGVIAASAPGILLAGWRYLF